MRKATLTAVVLLGFVALCLGGCAGRGRAVFLREGCVNCHRFRDLGSGLAPDLSEVGTRRDAAFLRAKITGSGPADPASRMPAFTRLSWFELRSLVAFLSR